MRNTIRWIAVLLLQATILLDAAAQGESDQSTRSADQERWMPVSDFTDPPRAEIGSIAQGFGASRTAADNVKAPPGDSENATLAAIKALHEEVKSLEARIAAQDARIAMLERALENYTARNR